MVEGRRSITTAGTGTLEGQKVNTATFDLPLSTFGNVYPFLREGKGDVQRAEDGVILEVESTRERTKIPKKVCSPVERETEVIVVFGARDKGFERVEVVGRNVVGLAERGWGWGRRDAIPI